MPFVGAATGTLAVGSVPKSGATIVGVIGVVGARAHLLAPTTVKASLQASARVSSALRAPGGITIAGTARVSARLSAQGAYNIRSSLSVVAHTLAPGGASVVGRITVADHLRAPGGVSVVGRTTVASHVIAPGGRLISATVAVRVFAPGSAYVVRVVPSPKLPLFLLTDDTGPSSWPGRS